MRKFSHLFFGLLVPLSMLFIIVATLYFKLDYNFTKAMRIGVLSGFFIGLFVSFFITIFLLIMRSVQVPKRNIHKKTKKRKKINSSPIESNTYTHPIPSVTTQETILEKEPFTHIDTTNDRVTRKIMLLMDKELAYEVALQAITEKNIGILTDNTQSEGNISVHSIHEMIELSIVSLTRHTAQVTIESQKNSKNSEIIIKYLKEKELSFLQY